MPPPRFSVQHQNCGSHAAITVVGDIDLTTAPFIRTALAQCLHDLTRTVDVDLTAVGFCDVSGLNVFLAASETLSRTGRTGALLRLLCPPQSLVRVVEITGSDLLPRSPVPAGEPWQEGPSLTPADRSATPIRTVPVHPSTTSQGSTPRRPGRGSPGAVLRRDGGW
ncbi:STAS domain-containing protein [Streptomyces sp. NPDC006610]|uniref:STAS domain-containing protein n=1 Tax=Streptomyces sp. NPDC006610 TaxID=3154584 RepID=UPI0033B8BA1B